MTGLDRTGQERTGQDRTGIGLDEWDRKTGKKGTPHRARGKKFKRAHDIIADRQGKNNKDNQRIRYSKLKKELKTGGSRGRGREVPC